MSRTLLTTDPQVPVPRTENFAFAASLPWWSVPVMLMVLTFTLRVAYLLADCPLDLAPDEAHYWDWSRHLDWSYYSKGPLVAWIIWVGCKLFGPLSLALTGNLMFAIRLPAVLCGCLTLLGLAVLTQRVYRRAELTWAVVAVASIMPAFVAGSMLMTIDAPYVCCWTWALVLVHRQLFSERPPTAWVWAGLGVTVGLGVLAKYNMVLFVPMLGLFLLTTPDYRRYLGSFGFWLMVGVAGLCCLPILVWNAQHDWITLRHVGRQAGMNHSGIRWFGPVQFLVEQAGLWLGSGFVAWLLACRERARDEQAAFLWWMSVPMVIFFMVFSVRTLVEPNWPVAAYVAGGVLTVGWIARNLHSRLVRTATLATMVIGLIATIVIHRTDWLYPLHAASGTSASVRKWDPTCRLKGWQTLAEAVAQLRERCRQDGNDPVLAGSNWALPGILAVYQADHPEVYSLGVVQGGRFSQYEFWRPNPVADPEPYLSRSFLYVGEISPEIKTAFERLEPSQIVEHHQAGQRVASWTITLCHGFRGFATIKAGGY